MKYSKFEATDEQRASTLTSFRSRVQPSKTGCWVIDKKPTRYGYVPVRAYGYNSVLLHRVIYYSVHGADWDQDAPLDHLCRNRVCCNPDHLEPVTTRENVMRGLVPNRETCRSGKHPWIKENWYIIPTTGNPTCYPCIKERLSEKWRTSPEFREKGNEARDARRARQRELGIKVT